MQTSKHFTLILDSKNNEVQMSIRVCSIIKHNKRLSVRKAAWKHQQH